MLVPVPIASLAQTRKNAYQSLSLPDHPQALGMCFVRDFGLKRDRKSSQWKAWLVDNVAYAHSAMVLACATQDCLAGRALSKARSFHLAKALAQLNQDLSDPRLTLHDTTLAAIISLGAASAIISDHTTAAAHLAGLRVIIRLRGGLNSLKSSPSLLVGISRYVFTAFIC
jgi:hypothetical protein